MISVSLAFSLTGHRGQFYLLHSCP